MAIRLDTLFDENSRAFRLGGDEFAVLHEYDDLASAEALASHVVLALGREFVVDGLRVVHGACVGLVS